jgi:hypothetical protein
VRVGDDDPYYRKIPVSVSHSPSPLEQPYPPWVGSNVATSELPTLEITTRDEMGVYEIGRWEDTCDTVVGFGHDRASVLFARFLLCVGMEATTADNFSLQGEASGHRSIGMRSSELRVWLPGSPGYVESD